jgi:hypothetical protein
MSRCTTVWMLLVALPLGTLSGQWLVGVDVAAWRFAAVASDTAPGGPWTTLTGSTAATFRVERQATKLRLGLGLVWARSGFATGDADFAVEARDVFRLWEVAPEVALRVAGAGPGATAWVHAGPILDVWLPEGADTRTRVGGQAGASLAFPLAGRVAGTIRLQGSVTPSVFTEAELPPGFEPRATRRLEVAVGFRYRP